MGKGYNNYMCKKPFHPGSKANIKRAWMAEQKTENEKRKQEELKTQYEKEQDLYNNRALVSSESKDKLQLNFMYEAPPGAKREHQKEDDEPEFKFEWQRKYNAPREDYAKGNEDIKDQPFGIPVRNVRCIKCHKWGHINTDKECPLYNQASTSSMPTTSMDPLELMRQMKEDGFGLKEHVLGHQLNPAAANQQFIPSDDESDPEIDFLKSLSSAEKKKLLKKLKKLSKKQERSSNCKKKKKSKKTKKSKSRASFSSDSEKEKKTKKKKSKKSSSSDSDSSSDESEKRQSKKNVHLKPKEKHSKSEKKNSKEHTNDKEAPLNTNYKHHSHENYNKKMNEEDFNANKSASKQDNEYNKRHDSKHESINDKTVENKHHSDEKYNKYKNQKVDNEHEKARNESKHESSDHVKHIRNSGEDFDRNRYASKDNVHKRKNESEKESFDNNKHKTKKDNYEKKIEDKKVRHYSSNSDEEKHPTIKKEPFCDIVGFPSPKRKSETSLYKDLISNKYALKEDILHKKIKSEPKEDSSDQDKNKAMETKHNKDPQTEKKDTTSEPNKFRTLDREGFHDDDASPPKRKSNASASEYTSNIKSDDDVSPSKRKSDTSTSEYTTSSTRNAKKFKYDHPDGFSHLCPQAHVKTNYLQPSEEYEGKIHDEFRHHYRDERSPSIKQKYNK